MKNQIYEINVYDILSQITLRLAVFQAHKIKGKCKSLMVGFLHRPRIAYLLYPSLHSSFDIFLRAEYSYYQIGTEC